ncbi:MAG: hypothetical protein ACSHX9_15130 [Luteolibacter sp.]
MFKTPLIVSLLLFMATVSYGEEADAALAVKEPRAPVSMWFGFEPIEGTTLEMQSTREEQELTGWTRHSCVLGYRREDEGELGFVPVLTLPPLENDQYLVTAEGGTISITTAKGKQTIAEFHLANIAPAAVKQKVEPVEKKGAGIKIKIGD